MYEATGINESLDEDENTKDLKHRMFAKLEGKLYSREEIEDMRDVVEMDIDNAFTWEQRTVTK
jgi:hypothetical protein